MAIPHHPPFEIIEIKIEWSDNMSAGIKTFNNVHELTSFLKENPAFAEALGYVIKETKVKNLQ